ncbi:MAG: hypothetical protein CL916_09050, partial [Deltaproteobacteria bacterium]|nr:hypothetical protein [Deltaproteobacteria bacterium]
VVSETNSALSAQEAHSQAVSRTQEANQAQKERQKESESRMNGYPERMAGVTALTIPLTIFQGFTWLGAKLPGGAGRAMGRMNEDANQMKEAFSQMDSQMEAQSQGQEGHRAALEGDSERLNTVSSQGEESRGNLDTANQGAQGLANANQKTIQNASDAEQEAASQGAKLDAAAESKKEEHRSTKERLVTWAKGHRDARTAANQQSASQS